MSSHKRSFQCFSAVPASHSHAGCRLPRIPDPDAAEEAACYLWSRCRHARAVEATPLCPYHRHQHGRPSRPDEPPPRAKRVVLIKNSEPSLRKTVVLQRKGLRSLGLFLEEVSELLQYHVRRLYTLDGHKVENVQSIIQCPSVLVCVGREPSHPSILERFRRTAEDKLPKLTAKARSTGNEVQPKLTSANRSTRHSVSSEKSLPDGTESPDVAGTVSPTADGTLDDNVEKQVRINKDGSLSMKMKVRFRLDNDETLLWSTEVTKSTNKAGEFPQELDSVGSCSGSEIFSAGEPVEPCVTRRRHRHAQCSRYPHCYNIWTNGPGPRGDSCGVQTSSSSASSRTFVSRKTVAQRSSEENAEQVVEQETCVETSETVEYCTIRAGSRAMENSEPKEQPGAAVSGDDASPGATRPSSQSGKPVQDEATEGTRADTSGKSSSGSSDAKRSGTVKQSKKSYACYCGTSKDYTEASSEETGKVERPQSSTSAKPNVSPNAEPEGGEEERYNSAMSAHSNTSTKCKAGVFEADDRPPSQTSVTSEVKSEQCQPEKEAAEETPPTSLSSKSKTSVTSAGTDEDKAPEEKDHGEQSETGAGLRTQSQTSVSKAPPLSAFDRSKEDSQEESKSTEEAQGRAPSARSSVSNASAGMSTMSARSRISARSSKSKCSADVPAQDESRCSGDEENKQTEKRPSSCTSATSTLSQVSAERSPSASSVKSHVSRKSAQANLSEVSASKRLPNENLREECDERAQSAASAETAMSTPLMRSTEPKGDDDARDQEERALSERSARSAKSHVSAPEGSLKDSVSDHGADSSLEEHSGSISLTSLSMKSSKSARSARSKCSVEVCRPKSDASGTSHVSHEPVTEHVSSRAGSKLSAKSAKSNQSKVSAEENAGRRDLTERALSNSSIRSAKSTSVSGASRGVSELMSEHSVEIADVESEELISSEQSVASAMKKDSDGPAEDTSQCADHDEDREQPEEGPAHSQACDVVEDVSECCMTSGRAASSSSAKSAMSAGCSTKSKTSVHSLLHTANETESEHRNDSEERSASAASAKSTRTNGSESLRSIAACEETTPRPPSAVTAKSTRSAKSAHSMTSAKSKSSVAAQDNDDEIIQCAVSSASGKSDRSGRSKSSAATNKSKATADAANTDDIERRAKSVVSLLSGGSQSSLRPQNECGEEGRRRSATTNKSETIFKSRSSNISDGSRVEGVQETTAVSVKSNRSSRSRKSGKGSSDLNEGTDERSKSATSNVSAKSTKSDLPVVAIEESEPRAHTAVRSKSQASATSEALERKSKESAHSGKSKKGDLLVAKDHDKQPKAIPQSVETSVDGDVSCEHVPNGPEDATDAGRSDKKSDAQTVDGDDDEALVPSSLPNASLTEVVNEWLNKIPPDGELFDMEELGGNVLRDTDGNTVSENNLNGLNEGAGVSDGERCHETAGEKGANHPRDTDSEIFHSSVLVMKVLLNPKLDRCSSLPEVSPSYGRKLSTSATGLIDCLAKLQLIDTNPTSADEKSQRYKALVEGLRSLWLCDPAENEPALEEKADRHSDKDFNQGSSSGIDVNSGSTGSGKSSGGGKQQQTLEACKAQEVPQEEEAAGAGEEQMREESPKGDASTDGTIRSNDSPRVSCDSPRSSDEISGSPRQSLKQRSHDPDPVWVLNLLTKIEKQFMTHYVNAMCEFRNQWNVDDHEQLDRMISELKDEIHRRIQASINRELRKIKGRAGLPRPPKEAKSRPSTTQTDERRRRLRMKTEPAGKSDDSATSTIFSDQRGEIEEDNCPCESCLRKKMSPGPRGPAEVRNTAPVLVDFDLQRILRMRNDHRMQDTLANSETKAAAARLVGQILDLAVREAAEDGDMEDAFAVLEWENEAETMVEETRTENAPSQEVSECEVSGGDLEANADEDEDEAKESTGADGSLDQPEEDGAVDMASQTSATTGDESDRASTVKDSDEATAENAPITEVAAEDEGAAREAAAAVTSPQESEEVEGEEEPPAASGEENHKPATANQSNDDQSGRGGGEDGEGPDAATFEDEYSPQDATVAASDDNKTQEEEEARESQENDEASALKNSNEDASTVDEVSADDGGEDEDAASLVTTRATTEHESEPEEELAGEDQDETPATSADEKDEEAPKTVEDATPEAAGSATSERQSEEDEEGGVDSREETPEDEYAADVEMMSEEVSEAAAQATDSNKEEPEGGEETLVTSAAENEDVADTEQRAEEDHTLRENVADTTAAQEARGSAASGQESADEFDGKVDGEGETCAASAAENEDAATDDQAAAIGGMSTEDFPETVKDEDAQEAATSQRGSEKHKEPKVGGEGETPVTSGDEDEDEDGADTDEDGEEDDSLSENDAGATAAAEKAAREATVSATSGEQSEEEEERKVDGEEETPAPSGDATDQDATKDGLTTEDVSETVKDDNAEEAATSEPESEEEKESAVGGEEETPAASADENRGAASTEDDEDDDSATVKDQTNAPTKKEDLDGSQQDLVDDNENSGEEDPARTSDGGEDASEAPDDEDLSDQARGEDANASEAADRAEEGEVANQEEAARSADQDADQESALSAEDQDAMMKESEFEGPEAEPEECFQKDQVRATGGDSAEASGEERDEGEDGSNDAQAAEDDPASCEDDEKEEPVLTHNQDPDEALQPGKENKESKEERPQDDDRETHGESFEASEKEEQGPESTGRGESADGEDGADSDDDDDQEEKSEARDFIPGEAANQKADNGGLSERTTLRVKTALSKSRAESEGGIEADGEDSDA
ncbi:retinitis pigmentosa 1-like 1 protein [Hippocampus zosterae]|uniref:retinitis pigmentosa 1-like 1 protein n=1 Tax=Hippocampus zosterae TaxID=109293 RepID=UPI00223E5ADC|nr:retinitis pigmentosa 1-like 1 protein [Hippocampus zosterae]